LHDRDLNVLHTKCCCRQRAQAQRMGAQNRGSKRQLQQRGANGVSGSAEALRRTFLVAPVAQISLP
jgi:hypothetical protein